MYGMVYTAMLENGSILAVKTLRQDLIKDDKELKAEMAVLGKVRHPNLLGLRAYHLGQHGAFLVFDYMRKGSLPDLLHGQISGLLFFHIPAVTDLQGMPGGPRHTLPSSMRSIRILLEYVQKNAS
jgi:serine/threonine protein kinase